MNSVLNMTTLENIKVWINLYQSWQSNRACYHHTISLNPSRLTASRAIDEWYHGTMCVSWQMNTVFVRVTRSMDKSSETKPFWWHNSDNFSHCLYSMNWCSAVPGYFAMKSNGPTSTLFSAVKSTVSLNRLWFLILGVRLGLTKIGRP